MLQRRASNIERLFRATAAIACLALLAGCSADHAGDEPSPVGSAAGEVRRGDLEISHLLTGELKAITADAIIVPRTPSWQMPIRWMEKDGAQVREGDRVLELDNSVFAGDLEQKRLQQARALNELMQKEADLEVQLADLELAEERARITLEKATIEADIPEEIEARRKLQELRLTRDKAQIDLEKSGENLKAKRESAQAELEVLRIALRKIEAEVRVSEQAIDALTVRAPRDGILVVANNRQEDRKFQTGDTVRVGNEVMTIPDLSSMKVEAQLSDVDDGKLTVGMVARCTLDTYPDLVFDGKVVDITPVAKEQGRRSTRRAFRVVVHLERSDPERMRPGMSVQVEVTAPSVPDVILVPRAALQLDGETSRARMAGGGTREVELGACNPQECAVERGLDAGDRVRVSG